MAAYPSTPKRTKVKPINDRKSDVSDAGTVRQVDLSAAQVYQIAIEHPYITSSELSTLLSFWTTNKGTTVTVTAGDGYTYDCLFVNEPEVEPINSARSNARVVLVGNRN